VKSAQACHAGCRLGRLTCFRKVGASPRSTSSTPRWPSAPCWRVESALLPDASLRDRARHSRRLFYCLVSDRVSEREPHIIKEKAPSVSTGTASQPLAQTHMLVIPCREQRWVPRSTARTGVSARRQVMHFQATTRRRLPLALPSTSSRASLHAEGANSTVTLEQRHTLRAHGQALAGQ